MKQIFKYNLMGGLEEGIPLIGGIFELGKYIYDGINESRRAENSQKELERAYRDKLNQLNEKKRELLNEKKEFDIKIENMKKQIKEQKDSFKKMKLEN